MTGRQQEQADFLGGELTTTFLGEAGVESIGASGVEGQAIWTTIIRISIRICPTPRGGCTATPRCTIFC